MENVGHRKYLEKVNSQTLDDINEHVLELDVGSSGDNIVAFLLESEVIGLEYFFFIVLDGEIKRICRFMWFGCN